MGLNASPEVRMARKVLKKHNLSIPFDLEKLVKNYAKVHYKLIPIDGVDGVCINIKKIGKIPIVIVNNNASTARQNFTLAHEFGHIIIPWHLGTIIDDIDVDNTNPLFKDQKYWELEREANRFASELLMPLDFIFEQFKINPDPESLLEIIKRKCGVSDAAARIRFNNAITEISDLMMPEEQIKKMFSGPPDLITIQNSLLSLTPFAPLHIARHMSKYLPGKIAFCVEENGIVKGCGSTDNTQMYYQSDGDEFQSFPYPHFQSYHVNNNYGVKTHWWSLDVKYSIDEDTRDWREILNTIAVDLNPMEGIVKFTRSINGKISGLNSQRLGKGRYAKFEEFLEEAIHRFNTKEYEKLVAHPDFLIFVKKRVLNFFK